MFRTLRGRLLLATLVILVSTFTVFSLMSIRWLKSSLVRSQEIRTTLLGETVKRGLMVTMLMGQGKEIQTVLQAMAQHEEIELLRIFDPKGRVRESSRAEEIGSQVPPTFVEMGLKSSDPRVFHQKGADGQPVITLLQRIDNLPRCHRCHDPNQKVRGILELRVSLAGVMAEINTQRLRLIWTAAGAFMFLSAGLWFMLYRVVARPVERLSLAMRQAQQGDLSARAPETGPDELAQLGKGFNSTMAALSETRRKFEAARHAEMHHMERLASIGEMASGIAHEIKNPLAGIAGSAEVIRDQMPAGDSRRDVLNAILSHVERLRRSIETVLAYVRTTPTQRKPTRFEDLLDRLTLLAGPEIQKKSIRVVADVPHSLAPLWVDPEKMQQVLLNLALNAVQAMTRGGTLTLSARPIMDDRIEVRISDTGMGIPRENLAKIFDPFFTTRREGTGLGLTTAKRIIEEHGGDIAVESTRGVGTTFTIVLQSAGAGT